MQKNGNPGSWCWRTELKNMDDFMLAFWGLRLNSLDIRSGLWYHLRRSSWLQLFTDVLISLNFPSLAVKLHTFSNPPPPTPLAWLSHINYTHFNYTLLSWFLTHPDTPDCYLGFRIPLTPRLRISAPLSSSFVKSSAFPKLCPINKEKFFFY